MKKRIVLIIISLFLLGGLITNAAVSEIPDDVRNASDFQAVVSTFTSSTNWFSQNNFLWRLSGYPMIFWSPINSLITTVIRTAIGSIPQEVSPLQQQPAEIQQPAETSVFPDTVMPLPDSQSTDIYINDVLCIVATVYSSYTEFIGNPGCLENYNADITIADNTFTLTQDNPAYSIQGYYGGVEGTYDFTPLVTEAPAREYERPTSDETPEEEAADETPVLDGTTWGLYKQPLYDTIPPQTGKGVLDPEADELRELIDSMSGNMTFDGNTIYVNLNVGGRDISQEGTWSWDDSNILISIDGETISADYTDDQITFDTNDQSLVFKPK